jgi:hypothetical protein
VSSTTKIAAAARAAAQQKKREDLTSVALTDTVLALSCLSAIFTLRFTNPISCLGFGLTLVAATLGAARFQPNRRISNLATRPHEVCARIARALMMPLVLIGVFYDGPLFVVGGFCISGYLCFEVINILLSSVSTKYNSLTNDRS